LHGSLVYFVVMLKKPEAQQQELEMVSIESLVPSGHLLRKIDRAVDFGFIRERVQHLYCEDNGRPALEPVCCSSCCCWGICMVFGRSGS
jgi:hypothetical protein